MPHHDGLHPVAQCQLREDVPSVGLTVPLGGPRPVSWREVVAVFERELDRRVPVQELSPSAPASGLPGFVVELLAAMDQYDSPVDMAGTTATYGVEPTFLESFVHTLVGAAHA